MASGAAAEVQALLRFLTQDAKVPLAAALSKVNDLRKGGLESPEAIGKSKVEDVQKVFPDQKLAKQVLAAAKRISTLRKRSASDAALRSPVSKRAHRASASDETDTGDVEADLTLPHTDMAEDDLRKVTLQTNRAPLVLAFAVILLKYTMPEQPPSSRLSLAQGVVSANSRRKAQAIGLETGKSAEDEGWGKGQPKARVMGREITVMRRAGYVPAKSQEEWMNDQNDSQKTVQGDRAAVETPVMPLWGLDLEALRKSNGPLVAGKNASGQSSLPIFTAQGARNYLLNSFSTIESESSEAQKEASQSNGASSRKVSPNAKKKLKPFQIAERKEEAAAMLLSTLDLLYQSWASTLSRDELDRRAWSWYLHVRPDIAQGVAGWGQKGMVRLEDILKLKRPI